MFTSFRISSIFLSLALFSIFVVIFFFTYAQHIEKKIISNQVISVVDDMKEDLDTLKVPKDVTDLILLSSKNPNLEEEDKEISKNNRKLLIKAVLMFGCLFLICVIGIYYFWKRDKYDFKDLLKKNLITMLFVALTEIYFMNRFAKNYISLDPNIVKLELLKNIEKLGD